MNTVNKEESINRIKYIIGGTGDSNDIGKIADLLVDTIHYCNSTNWSFTSILELASEIAGIPKPDRHTRTLYQLVGMWKDSGEDWKPFGAAVYTTRERAERQMEIEINAYTWDGECPIEFSIRKIEIE